MLFLCSPLPPSVQPLPLVVLGLKKGVVGLKFLYYTISLFSPTQSLPPSVQLLPSPAPRPSKSLQFDMLSFYRLTCCLSTVWHAVFLPFDMLSFYRLTCCLHSIHRVCLHSETRSLTFLLFSVIRQSLHLFSHTVHKWFHVDHLFSILLRVSEHFLFSLEHSDVTQKAKITQQSPPWRRATPGATNHCELNSFLNIINWSYRSSVIHFGCDILCCFWKKKDVFW